MLDFTIMASTTPFAQIWRFKEPPNSKRVLLTNYLIDVIVGIFRNKAIEREGLNFLERLFKQ